MSNQYSDGGGGCRKGKRASDEKENRGEKWKLREKRERERERERHVGTELRDIISWTIIWRVFSVCGIWGRMDGLFEWRRLPAVCV